MEDSTEKVSIRSKLPSPTTEEIEEVNSTAALSSLWLGAGAGALRLEVCELTTSQKPTNDLLRRAWRQRRAARAVPLIVFCESPDQIVHFCGPSAVDPSKVPVFELGVEPAITILRQALATPPQSVVPTILRLIERAYGDGGIAGFQNRNLVSTHCVVVSFRRNIQRWEGLVDTARDAADLSGIEVLRALGYSKAVAPGTFIVEHEGRTVVYASVLPDGAPFDRAVGMGQDPATVVLAEARKRHATRAVIVSGRLIRTYAVAQTESLDDIPTPATYSEVDLDLLGGENMGLLSLLAGAASLKPGGAFEALQEESRIYNRELRERFQQAIYDKVIGRLVRALWGASTDADRREPSTILGATLLFLYRLLFVLYAEDRRLLPMSNPAYRHASLTEMLFRIEARDREDGKFDERATDYWAAITALFRAIRSGHIEWGVAEYDGGLFETDEVIRPESVLLDKVNLTNSIIAPILLALAFDGRGLDRGKIDFWDIGVRYLGTLYEGLLAYNVRIADRNLRIVEDGYAPASPDEEADVKIGEPFLITPRGGRKASGTYYTPNFVVRRLIDDALRPSLEAHLQQIIEFPAREQWRAMLDFRVVDPAMGSGHFLVDAVDAIADRLAAFLDEHKEIDTRSIAEAREHLNSLGRSQGIDGQGDSVPDFDLLRRIVLKNCIYGVDIQPMAVELARLSLWLHTFVPGMPLSYLGHGLRCGNSLVGIIGDEIVQNFGGKLFGSIVQNTLEGALEPARMIGAGGDLTVHDVHESGSAQRALQSATKHLARAYDVFSCRCFMGESAIGALENTDLMQTIVTNKGVGKHGDDVALALERSRELNAFHWQLGFPEVFLRERPGFDVILGNPPWEEVTVERLGFYTGYIPGLKSVSSQREQEHHIQTYETTHPDVKIRFERELERTDRLRVLIKFGYELSRSGDPDLYRAFAEVALRLSREGGAIGMVFPRTLLSGDGMAPYRAAIFPISETTLDFGLNKGGWIFAGAEQRYTIVALALRRNSSGLIHSAGPVVSEKEWSAMPDTRITWTVEELRKASEGLEIPLIPDKDAAKLFRKIVANGQRFDATIDGVHFRPWRPIDATMDRQSGLLKEKGEGWPVYAGDNFNLWTPEVGEPPFVLEEEKGIAFLQSKRLKSPVWRGRRRPCSGIQERSPSGGPIYSFAMWQDGTTAGPSSPQRFHP